MELGQYGNMKDRIDPKVLVMTIIAIAMLVSVFHRSTVASFTHDESYSFMYYPQLSFLDIVVHKESFTNNHLLNSLGMKCAGALFGTSELSMRSPNILAFIIYLTYAFLFLRRLDPVVACLGYLILVSNPIILEMFSIARGYGISIGFMLMALYHLTRALRSRRPSHIVLFHLAGILAVLGSFVLFGTYLAIFSTYVILRWIEIVRHRTGYSELRREAFFNGVMIFVAVGILVIPIARTLSGNKLDFGGKEGFFDSTVFSVVASSIPGISIAGVQLPWIIAAAVAVSLFMFIASYRNGSVRSGAFTEERRTFIALAMVLFLTSLSIVLQHLLFNVDYPVARFAIFLIPLALLPLIFYGTALRGRLVRLTHKVFIALFGLGSIVVLWPQFGPYRSVEWQYDLCTKEAVQLIVDDMDMEQLSDGSVELGITWLFEPTINYYRDHWGIAQLERMHRNGPGPNDAYRYLVKQDVDPKELEEFTLIKEFEVCGTVLYRRSPDN